MQALSPLPLDLHVLSLSLAFILSQDQTLRCCLSCFFFFQKILQGKLLLLFCLLQTRQLRMRFSLIRTQAYVFVYRWDELTEPNISDP